ncbi:MAG: glycosyltransferase [Deltaproteobacteria bacterium]|nr:glycosyltransferase [Deltaproteobacteria bacterium]
MKDNQSPKISLCMIVKDEAHNLVELLSKAKLHCDEMIIVDTGSTDNSVQVAKEAGASVYAYAWQNDFSKARNFSIEKAMGDWILVLDADERLSDAGWQKIKETIAGRSESFFNLAQINYVNDPYVHGFQSNSFLETGFEQYKGFTISWLVRLFRNHMGYRFQGAVHEHLCQNNQILEGERLDVKLHHHGLVLSPEKMQQKKRFYLDLGIRKVNDDPTSTKAWHELGVAYWEMQDLLKAAEQFDRALEINPDYLPSLIARGSVYQHLKQNKQAEADFIHILKLDPRRQGIAYALGRLAQEQGDFQKALDWYKQEIRVQPGWDPARFWLSYCYDQLRSQDPQRKPSVSICYITKNEESCLAESLRSVKDHADEIIVLDTGSHDKTKEIAKEWGAKVFDFEWQNDFALARNHSLVHATGEWVLVLDADEVLSEKAWAEIQHLLLNASYLEYYLVQTTYTNASTILRWKANDIAEKEAEGYKGYFESPLVRLFRNTPKIKFFGAVHEHAAHEDSKVVPCLTKIRIHHYGKFRDEERMQDKANLYKAIGEKKLADMPEEPHAFYEMAVQNWELEQMDDVEDLLLKAIELDPNHMDAQVAYACFLQQEARYPDALEQFAKVIALKPEHAEAHFFLSSVLIELKKYDLALQMLQKAKALGFHNEVALALNEGMVALNVKDFAKAIEIFKNALRFNDEFEPVLSNLALAYLKAQDFQNATEVANKLLKAHPQSFVAYKYLGEIAFNLGHIQQAQDNFRKASELNPNAQDVKVQLLICCHVLKESNELQKIEKQLFEKGLVPDNKVYFEKVFEIYKARSDHAGLQRLSGYLAVSNQFHEKEKI